MLKQLSFIMRLIEKEMNHAIRVQKKYFSKGNTAVRTSADGIESQIYLHHNLIGSYNHPKRELTIFDGGWQSNTTKSRLNVLIGFVDGGIHGIYQKNFRWYLDTSKHNDLDITDNSNFIGV